MTTETPDGYGFLDGLTDEELERLYDAQYGTHSSAHQVLAAGRGELVGSCVACSNEAAIEAVLDRRNEARDKATLMTSTESTESRLAAIKERLRLATPGPWLTPAQAGDPYAVKVIDHEGCQVWPWESEADMTFAYAAREDVPFLLSEVAALQARSEAVEHALGEINVRR